ncbi:methyl-accepting chemotaxis protein [Halomonas sp. McH1-25]|uniref:methyl-accepting chemotaxis protein n=3 Tax=Halomonas TaxID=2745 RepID=UPI001EF4922E|nr:MULTISPECIES: methyl-accepting chemotaxis protein [unclassified Halomonas]MCG7599537.1 methyl-accepting chemotaxis protein [Halomonas sp. McH1-25]MCP1342190.1 methyl-accepting chemotaxis protein [Halomonas sp. FL8]MCP1364807.1 methyl-accepting chemotaxis protein [Halomonas sp. BBD48]
MLSSLKRRIQLACAGIIAIAMALVAGVGYVTIQSHYEATIEKNLTTVATSSAATIEEWVAARRSMIGAARSHVMGDDPVPALVQLAESGGFLSTYIGKPDGSLITSDGWVPPADYDPRKRGWYQQAVEHGETVVAMPYVDGNSGQVVLPFSTPVEKNGKLLGVIGGDVVIDAIVKDVAAIQPTPSSFAFLSTDGDTLIAHPDPELTLESLTQLSPALSETLISALRNDGGWRSIDINDQATRLAVTPIAGTDWELGVALDESEALAGLHAIIKSSLITLVLVTLIASVLLGLWLKRAFGGLERVRDALENIASGSGDLTRRLSASGRDEVAQIADAFNRFVDKMERVLIAIRDSSESVSVASSEIAQGSQDLSSRTETTASNLQETSASMEQLTSTVEHTADSARQANQLSLSASEVASRGGEVVSQVVHTMGDIDASSRQIAEIVSVMDGIAFQTNLLALNASVEAARAGEQGRGFAVVAGEVRQLASRSADAARQIKELIDTSTAKTRAGAELVRAAGETMDEIVASVARVTEVLGEIGAATREQSQGIGQVNQAVAELDRMTQQNAALVEESAAAADQLQEQALRLTQVVGAFTLSRTVERSPSPLLASPRQAALQEE